MKENLIKIGETPISERIVLKKIAEDEYDKYHALCYENSFMKSAFDDPKFMDELWNDLNEPTTLNYSIYDEHTGEFCGYCGIHNTKNEVWEIGVELFKRYHRQGIGYAALELLLNKMLEEYGQHNFRSRVAYDNYASRKVMQKLGAVPNGIARLFLVDEELIKAYEEKYKDKVNDEIREIAAEFGVEPVKLLSHVLEYKITK